MNGEQELGVHEDGDGVGAEIEIISLGDDVTPERVFSILRGILGADWDATRSSHSSTREYLETLAEAASKKMTGESFKRGDHKLVALFLDWNGEGNADVFIRMYDEWGASGSVKERCLPREPAEVDEIRRIQMMIRLRAQLTSGVISVQRRGNNGEMFDMEDAEINLLIELLNKEIVR